MRSDKLNQNFFNVIILTAVLIMSCSNKEKQSGEENTIAVKTAKVLKEEVSFPIHSSGKLSSSSEIKLSFKTGGIIEKIYCAEGKSVNSGEILAELNLSEINAQVLKAEQVYEKAKRDLARIKKLHNENVATLEQLQNMKTVLNVAKSNWEIVQFNKKHSRISAPSNGRVLKQFNEEGEITSPGMPVFLFGTNKKGWIVKVGLTDKEIIKLNIGDNADIYFDAYPDEKFTATVTETGQGANPYSGTFEVELTLDNAQQKLASGFVAKVDIYPSQKEIVTTIPIEALFEAHGQAGYIFTYNSESMTAEKRNIIISQVLPTRIAVSKGLENIQTVITDGVEYLSTGSKVEVK